MTDGIRTRDMGTAESAAQGQGAPVAGKARGPAAPAAEERRIAEAERSGGTVAPVLAEAVRSGFTESLHRGSLVVLGRGGDVELALGDVVSPVFPRSANKPMQAAGVLRAGADLSGERLALATGSHSGERFHQDLVRTMLAEAGLTPAALRTPADLPIDPVESQAHLAAGGSADPVAMNCSGKHAAMLAACVAAGWPVHGYVDPEHPLQLLVRETIEEASGEKVAHTGVDGCGAPLLAFSLTGLARAFRFHVTAGPGSAERRVADAMRAHPEYVAGTRRIDTWLMREVPGALAKVGAEAVQAVALADGRALAFKIEDGAKRAVGPVLARALRLMGVTDPVLDRVADSPLLGGGRPAGEVRAVF
ncbi:asparaginase [Streptomyces sp. NPDC047108]|uniref:asparaginase n=1 Tax=Streptomyces sp. NPDC047108 TaxID=3155025 RepID=UPI0033EE1075